MSLDRRNFIAASLEAWATEEPLLRRTRALARALRAEMRIEDGEGEDDFAPVEASMSSAIKKTAELLESLDVKAAVIGGLAIQRWTRSRTTKDIDIIVTPEDFYMIQTEIEGQTGGDSGVSIYTVDFDGTKVDFMDRENAPWSDDAIDTAVIDPATKLRIVKPEYLILYKLLAGRAKDEEDVKDILKAKPKSFDKALDLAETHDETLADDLRQLAEEVKLAA